MPDRKMESIEIPFKSPWSLRMREKTDQKNSKYCHFLHSGLYLPTYLHGQLIIWITFKAITMIHYG